MGSNHETNGLVIAVALVAAFEASAYEVERVNRHVSKIDGTVYEWKVDSEGYHTRTLKKNMDGSTTYVYPSGNQVREKTNRDGSLTRTGDLKAERW